MTIAKPLIVIFEQIALSALSFGSNVIFATLGSRNEYVIYSLALCATLIISGYFRSTVVIPFIYRQAGIDEVDIAWWTGFSSAVALLLVCLTVSASFFLWVAGLQPVWSEAFFCSAMMSLTSLPAEFVRRVWMDKGYYYTSAIAAVSIFIVANASLIILYFTENLTAAMGSVLVSLSYFVVYMPCILPTGLIWAVKWQDLRDIFLAARRNILYSNISSTIFSVYNHCLPFIIGILGGAPAVATFNASRLLSQPAWVLVIGLDNRERAELALAHREPDGQAIVKRGRRYVARTLSGVAILNLILLALSFMPPADQFFSLHRVTEEHILIWLLAGLVVAIAFPMEAIRHAAGGQIETALIRFGASVTSISGILFLPFDDIALRGIVAYLMSWLFIAVGNMGFLLRGAR